jgi:hypothetical protein
MIHSPRRDRKTKAIAEALAMTVDAHPELAPHHPHPVRETDEWLWESATEFCAALDRRRRRKGHGARQVGMPTGLRSPATGRCYAIRKRFNRFARRRFDRGARPHRGRGQLPDQNLPPGSDGPRPAEPAPPEHF